MYKEENSAKELTFENWQTLEKIFEETEYLKTIQKLRKRENEPTKAYLIFPSEKINHGHERINIILRKNNIPLRLTRIGLWIRGEKREDRLLAFVQWSEDHFAFHSKNRGAKKDCCA